MFLHGIFPPITTPFYPDGTIYYGLGDAASFTVFATGRNGNVNRW